MEGMTAGERAAARTEYEFRRLTLPRGVTRTAAQRLLTDQAEYGHWELARLRLSPDGSRDVLLRRTILRWRAADALHR
jgi:hypothetical protein